ncbi:MAG: hypothetical protein ACFFB3_15265 [Candidatus Hodarchaeota archaeon]
MAEKPNSQALEELTMPKIPQASGLRLLILVDRKTDPKPLSRFLHNFVTRTSVEADASRLIFYKVASLAPYVAVPFPNGFALYTANLDWDQITREERDFLEKLATLVNDAIPEIKTEAIVGSSLKEIADYLLENQETLPDLIVMEKRSANFWHRLRRSLGLAKTDIEELSDELAVPVVRVPHSYDSEVVSSLERRQTSD